MIGKGKSIAFHMMNDAENMMSSRAGRSVLNVEIVETCLKINQSVYK